MSIRIISRGRGKKNLRGRSTAQIVQITNGPYGRHSRTFHCEDLGSGHFRTLNNGTLIKE